MRYFTLTTVLGVALAFCVVSPVLAQEKNKLIGSGATFPAPLYKQWISTYQKLEPLTTIEYQAIGSGEGIKRFLADTIDFGASDSAMTDEQISAAKNGAVLVPMTASQVVLAYNLPGLNSPLKLSREAYVGVLSGKITKWNDPQIQAANPGLNLPNQNIMLVTRQDSSGTTFAITNHLSAISQEWRDRGAGAGSVIEWPDNSVPVRGNEAVASRIKYSFGSLGYLEYGSAKQLGLSTAHIENKAGRFVAPGSASGQAAISKNIGKIPANLRVFISDPDGAESYPIVSFSWLLLKEKYAESDKAELLKRFVGWALVDGQNLSEDLGFIRLPHDLSVKAKAALARVH
jgi:phosphate transport system substrate-binding protein